MTVQEACAQAFENGRRQGDAEGYARGKAEAVKHGRWIALDWDHVRHEEANAADEYECSACGEYVTYSEITEREDLPKYCPNCGARMDGDGDA